MVNNIEKKLLSVTTKLQAVSDLKAKIVQAVNRKKSIDLAVLGIDQHLHELIKCIENVGKRPPIYDSLHQVDIAGDGDCLFNAVRLHLPADTFPSAQVLRDATADYLKKNRKTFVKHWDRTKDGEFDEYVIGIRRDRWGGDYEISAIVQITKRPIVVIQTESSPLIFNVQGASNASANIAQRPIFLLCNGRNHYDSLTLPEDVDSHGFVQQLIEGTDVNALQPGQSVGYALNPASHLKIWLRDFRTHKAAVESDDDDDPKHTLYDLLYHLTRVSLHDIYDGGYALEKKLEKVYNAQQKLQERFSSALQEFDFGEAVKTIIRQPMEVVHNVSPSGEEVQLDEPLNFIRQAFGIGETVYRSLLQHINSLLEPKSVLDRIDSVQEPKSVLDIDTYDLFYKAYISLEDRLCDMQRSKQASDDRKLYECLSEVRRTTTRVFCENVAHLLDRLLEKSEEEFREKLYGDFALSTANILNRHTYLKSLFNPETLPLGRNKSLETKAEKFRQRVEETHAKVRAIFKEHLGNLKSELELHLENAKKEESDACDWLTAGGRNQSIPVELSIIERSKRGRVHAHKAKQAMYSACQIYDSIVFAAPDKKKKEDKAFIDSCLIQRIILRRRMAHMLFLAGSNTEAQIYLIAAQRLLKNSQENLPKESARISILETAIKRVADGLDSELKPPSVTDLTALSQCQSKELTTFQGVSENERAWDDGALIARVTGHNIDLGPYLHSERRLVRYELHPHCLQQERYEISLKRSIGKGLQPIGALGVASAVGEFSAGVAAGILTTTIIISLVAIGGGIAMIAKGRRMSREADVRERLNRIIKEAVELYLEGNLLEFMEKLAEKYDENKSLITLNINDLSCSGQRISEILLEYSFRPDGIGYLSTIIAGALCKGAYLPEMASRFGRDKLLYKADELLAQLLNDNILDRKAEMSERRISDLICGNPSSSRWSRSRLFSLRNFEFQGVHEVDHDLTRPPVCARLAEVRFGASLNRLLIELCHFKGESLDMAASRTASLRLMVRLEETMSEQHQFFT